ncbi:MAG: helix-turn-helix domain-containing protein [Bdellovibrionales bacterium]|nr:helix-turn-helix domain-containing protein [Bdellovibrionales bacterium]
MSTAKKLIDTLKEDLKDSKQRVSPTYIKLVEVFPLQPIFSKKQHEMALKVLEKLITYTNEDKSNDEGVKIYLKTLSQLVSDYEEKQFKASEVSGSKMLAYIMELQGLNQKDLSKELGGQSVVSKILKGERELNLRQIKSLAKRFKVSPEVFI